MKKYFVDTNVVVYANDRNAGAKQTRAIEVLTALMRAQNGVVSIQVLQEYASTALTKLNQDSAVVLRQPKLLEALIVVIPSPKMIRRSIEIRNAYKTGFWDAGIVAAAESADCDVILSEDLNTGQHYAGAAVANPFAPDVEIDT